MTESKWVRITLRLEAPTHRAIVKIVRKNDSSLNAEINQALKQYAAQGKKDAR